MYNWNTDTRSLERNREKYTVWKLDQLINYGLNGQKIDARLIKKYWDKLNLDPKRKNVLELWLYRPQS